MVKHFNSKYRAAILSTAALTALATSLPTAVMAQDEGDNFLETIMITARNRAESIQDVPLAVTAFDAKTILRKNIQDLDDVARFTAGFAFEDFDGGNANPAIRGQSTLRLSGREQSVAAFVDGIYLPRSWVVDLGTSAFQRIEIVKGPQSARYGRNAFAGAINYISTSPGDELEMNATGTVGSDERYDIAGAISIPLITDQLGLRLAYEHSEFDGSWENTHPNADAGFSPGTNGNVGGWNNDTFSALAVFTPTDFITVEASYMKLKKREEARAARWFNSSQGDGNCGPIQTPGGFSLLCGELPEPEETALVEPRGFGRQADIDIYRLSVETDISDAVTVFYQFGKIQADTITANTAESDPIGCGTILGPPVFPVLCNFQGSPIGSIDYIQHELRLTFDNGGPLRAALGGFYMDGDDRPTTISINQPGLGTDSIDISIEDSAFPGNLIFRNELTNTESISVFAEVTYAFNEGKTRFSVEGRYTAEKINTLNLRTDTPIVDEGATFKFFTPRITVEHDLSDDALLFATVARGAKAGGFNTSFLSPEFATFDPEFNWTYEVGSKNTFLSGAATLNLSAFYTDWSNLQINIQDPLGEPGDNIGTLTDNLGDARIFGFEIEGSYQATDNLSVDTALSYTNAKYKDGTIDGRYTVGRPPNFPVPCDDTICASSGEIGGNTLERSPNWQAAFGVQWENEISTDLGYYIRADAAYQSSHFAESINISSAPGRVVVNGRLGFDYKETVTVSFWARNLLDKKYISNSLQIIQAASTNLVGTYYGERRTFGLTAAVRY